MANEKRLIDANAFWNLLQLVVYDIFTVHECGGQLTGTASVGYYTTTIEEVLKQTPTVDAVEVVRCGNCVKRPKNVEWGMCHVLCRQTHKDDFCSCGEKRRDGDGNG